MTLEEAKAWLRQRLDEGAECPCCTQFVRQYRRKMTATAARTLVELCRIHGTDYAHVPTLLRTRLSDVAHQGGYATLSQHWGLIEERPGDRSDGSHRAGWWRVTEAGLAYVAGDLRVPKYALLYDGRCRGLTGDLVDIRDALGSRFDYSELMVGL